MYASFAWATPDDSPPADAKGFVTNPDCSHSWVCTDRLTGVANMVGCHIYVGREAVANWYDDGVNLIAFSRGHRGWIAINNSTGAETRTFATGLAPGTYCDIIHGSFAHGSCSGPTVKVAAGGTANVAVAAKDAVGFDTADRLDRGD